jgi:Ca2+-binding RTX toxin-like protein
MATYQFSELANGAQITFGTTDVLNFGNPETTPTVLEFEYPDTSIAGGPAQDFVVFAGHGPEDGKSVVLLDFNPYALKPTSFTFASGGKLFVGDRTAGTLNDDAGNLSGGTAQDDQFIGLGGDDTLNGAAGNDVFAQYPGDNGSYGVDSINGGLGSDWVVFSPDALNGVTVNLAGTTGTMSGGADDTLSGGTLVSIENVDGTNQADNITGSSTHNELWGRDGDDTLSGGNGNDTLAGEAGNDSLTGGFGSDWVDYLDDPGGVSVYLNLGNATDGFGGSDTLATIENVLATDFADVIYGNLAVNQIYTGLGNDQVHAGGGNDTINGGGGIDKLWGGAGNDFINGGGGSDQIWGDAGNDTLVGSGLAPEVGAVVTPGIDTFKVLNMSNGLDVIFAFDTLTTTSGGGDANTDKIDLRGLFNTLGYTGTDPRADNGGWLKVEDLMGGAGSVGLPDAVISIDANGGGDSWQQILQIVDVQAATLTDSFFLFQ